VCTAGSPPSVIPKPRRWGLNRKPSRTMERHASRCADGSVRLARATKCIRMSDECFTIWNRIPSLARWSHGDGTPASAPAARPAPAESPRAAQLHAAINPVPSVSHLSWLRAGSAAGPFRNSVCARLEAGRDLVKKGQVFAAVSSRIRAAVAGVVGCIPSKYRADAGFRWARFDVLCCRALHARNVEPCRQRSWARAAPSCALRPRSCQTCPASSRSKAYRSTKSRGNRGGQAP